MQPSPRSAVVGAPFRLRTALGEVVAHRGWQQARAAIFAAVGRGDAVALLGLPGTGKTLLLQDLARTLRDEGWSARLIERGDALQPASGDDVLLVDEAGRMGADVLARLCATDMPFVLAALPGFMERLGRLPRSITPVTLEPLPPEEIARFVAARLAAAGRACDMLEPDAVFALARRSGGLLRLVNLLAGTALFLAEQERAPRICRRHVDEAASMRDDMHEDATPTAPAEAASPVETATPHAEAPPTLRVVPPVERQRRTVLGAAVAGLGLVLAGGWVVLGRPGLLLPGAQPNGPDRNPGHSRADAGDRLLGAQPADRVGDAESSRGEGSHVQQQSEEPSPGMDSGASSRPAASTNPGQRSFALGASSSFRGPVYNQTMRQGGQMSLLIRRQGASGAITARFQAWGGLLGSGELAGTLSDDGRILASGQLMMGKNSFFCDLSGLITAGKLTGAATFIRNGGGRAARSTFTLTQS